MKQIIFVIFLIFGIASCSLSRNLDLNSLFLKNISSDKFTRVEAVDYCNKLSVDNSRWYLPSQDELLKLSTDKRIKNKYGQLLYIKREYLDLLPREKNTEDLTFWTSDLGQSANLMLGIVVAFSCSKSDQLGITPLDKYDSYPDVYADQRNKYHVICKKE